ncbi:MAG: hypothetical protein COB40_03770 [Marinosulfonomonas sp.]|nr:MAG: hypothetical protein COB40_03770 [Marinosulfonomonas sp.]
MTFAARLLNSTVTALFFIFVLSSPLFAQTEVLDQLFDELAAPESPQWQRIEQEIWIEWSKSGSDSMDFLLERGRAAMSAGDYEVAIEHFTALTDHAPEFAEGWNARATAYFLADLYGPSLSDIRQTLALNPRHFGAMSGLGRILEQMGYQQEALDAFRAAQAIHPHKPSIKDTIERLEKELGGTNL